MRVWKAVHLERGERGEKRGGGGVQDSFTAVVTNAPLRTGGLRKSGVP